MIARAPTMGKEQYDIYFNISDVLGYFTLLAGTVPFWVMRCVARGKEGATKTGFVTNLIISALFTFAYLAAVPLILPFLGISTDYLTLYLVASVQIVEIYVIGLFEPCLQATTPQAVGYGLLVQQLSKLAFGYVLIIQFGQPLLGFIISTAIAFAIQIGYYFRLMSAEMKENIRWGYVKEWLKGSLANVYTVVGNVVATNSVLLLLFSLGGEGSRSLYGAAAIIVNVITYSSFLSFALYPKLIAEQKSEDITLALKIVLMFAIPMTAIAVALANSYIVILRPELSAFVGAGTVLAILAVDALNGVISGIYSSVVFGVESVDREALTFKSMVRSKIFVAFSLPYLQAAATIPATYFVLTRVVSQDPLFAALYVSIINASMRFICFLIVFAVARGMIKIAFPWRSVAKYTFASVVTAFVLFLLPVSTSVFVTVIWTAVGGLLYIGLLMLIDKETRRLPRDILSELRRTKKLQ
jgi:O-antigen/teichoic acid export membrane protein